MRPANKAILAAALLGAPLAVPPARACTISSSGVAFGAYNPQAAGPDNAMGTATVVCPSAITAPVVALSTGQSGTFAARRMTFGAYILTYNLYTNTARTIIWGDGTAVR